MVAVDGERQERWVHSHQSGSLAYSTLISYGGSAVSCNGVLNAGDQTVVLLTEGNLRNSSCPSSSSLHLAVDSCQLAVLGA